MMLNHNEISPLITVISPRGSGEVRVQGKTDMSVSEVQTSSQG